MQIVCDTSSLVKLRKAKALNLLEHFFTGIYLPRSVYSECELREAEIYQKVKEKTFQVETAETMLDIGMGMGEREMISLAVELQIDWVLTDDHRAIKRAKDHNLQTIRFFDILLAGKNRKLLSSVKNSLEAMISEGEGIEEDLYLDILQAAGE